MKQDLNRKNESQAVWSAFRFAWELGYTIALPLIILALGGALLDRWLGTKPWFLLGGVIISMGVSTIGVYFKAMKVIAQGGLSQKKDNQKKE